MCLCGSRYRDWINRVAKRHATRIVLALDILGDKLLDRSISLLRELHEHICAVKIGHGLILPLSLHELSKIIDASHGYDLPVIADYKVNDVGHVNATIASYLFKAGADALTISPFIGWEEGVQPVYRLAKEHDKGLLLICHMSHKGAREFYSQQVYDEKLKRNVPQYLVLARRALEWQVDGVVVGATYPEVLAKFKSIAGEKLQIYSPGVISQGGDLSLAVKNGADYIIIGRTICKSKNPYEEVIKVKERINSLSK